MKKLIIILSFSIIFFKVQAQVAVTDVGLYGTLIANTSVLKSSLSGIEREQKKIRNYQTSISVFLKKIEDLDRKVYKSLKDVQQIVKDGKNIIYAGEVITDIYDYSSKAVGLAKKDPVLIAFAYKGSKKMAERVVHLTIYVSNALKGGDFNLMSNMDRQEIIRHVVTELRVLRGIAYGIFRSMHYAQYGNKIKKLMQEFNIHLYTLDLFEKKQIVNDLKIW